MYQAFYFFQYFSIENQFLEKGIWFVKEQLLALDPNAANFVKLDNPSRVKRALELVIQSGKSLNEIYKKTSTIPNNTNIHHYCLDMPRHHLYHRINQRVDEMLQVGLLEEARNLFEFKELKKQFLSKFMHDDSTRYFPVLCFIYAGKRRGY